MNDEREKEKMCLISDYLMSIKTQTFF